MATIAELVRVLGEHAVDLFEQRRLREDVAGRGRPAISELLPLIATDPPLVEGLLHGVVRTITALEDRTTAREELEGELTPGCEPAARKACMRVLAAQFPEATHVGGRLLDFAINREHESLDVRLCALDAVERLEPASALGERLVSLLTDPDMSIVLKTLGVLRRYVGRAPANKVVAELERLGSPTSVPAASMRVRCDAIELLGQFGELDVLERVVLLPLTDAQEHEAVGKLVQHLLSKPRSVVHLTPKSFEHLVRRTLEKMGYHDVSVQPKGSWDEGVDVIAWIDDHNRMKGLERVKVIVQCKRYGKGNLVAAEVVDEMAKAMQAHGAARGLIVTTSGFAPAALERARRHMYMELVAGPDFQALLDKHFGKGLYRVGA